MDTLEFFLLHHRQLHSQIERDFLDSLTESQMRYRAGEKMHSITWLVWHMARCEDMMGFIVAGSPQLICEGDWLPRFNLKQHDIGTGMGDDEVEGFTKHVDLGLLANYYRAVGARTVNVVGNLSSGDLDGIPDSAHLSQTLVADGTAKESIIDFLIGEREGRTKGWWLGQLGLTHNHLHRGEALTVRGMQGIRNR